LAIASGEPAYRIHGQAWMDYGRLMHVEDTITNTVNPDGIFDYNHNSLQSVGAQFTVIADLTDHLEGGFGFGAYKASHALGNGQFSFLAISLFQNFLTQSRLTWYDGDKSDPRFSLTVGGFPFKYNPDVKNLGLYLLRGPVYPGALIGGFQDFSADSTKANMLGARLHHSAGIFSQDLILNSERDIPPTFDWSLAYLAKVKIGSALQLGAGVNFYRLIPYNSKLETPGKDQVKGSSRANYIEVDATNPAAPDTTFFTHQGTKLVGTASLDLKSLFGGMPSLGADDLKLYGEAGVIGTKDYGKAYGKISERIPVMAGFNFPTWGFLNHLSMEVEYYGARYRNDLALVGNNNVVADWTIQDKSIPSPRPPNNADYGIDSAGYFKKSTDTAGVLVRGTALDKENLTKDNLKWSLFADKVVAGHIQFVAQVADDHYRPRPVATNLIKSAGGTAEAFTSPKDWYYMLRVGYFF
jgi:hypothetical protein